MPIPKLGACFFCITGQSEVENSRCELIESVRLCISGWVWTRDSSYRISIDIGIARLCRNIAPWSARWLRWCTVYCGDRAIIASGGYQQPQHSCTSSLSIFAPTRVHCVGVYIASRHNISFRLAIHFVNMFRVVFTWTVPDLCSCQMADSSSTKRLATSLPHRFLRFYLQVRIDFRWRQDVRERWAPMMHQVCEAIWWTKEHEFSSHSASAWNLLERAWNLQ